MSATEQAFDGWTEEVVRAFVADHAPEHVTHGSWVVTSVPKFEANAALFLGVTCSCGKKLQFLLGVT